MSTHELGFHFRYGEKAAIDGSEFIDGYLNFSTDTGEFSLDKDGQRILLNNILVYNTVEEVYAQENPAPKIYLALDTMTLYYYNTGTLQWEYVGVKALEESFTTKEETTNIINDISDIKETIGNINRFEVSVLASGEDLPEEGTPYTIYFIPASYTTEDGIKRNLYTEYLWLPTESYYEQIGSSEVNMGLYYTKEEMDSTISDINSTITNNHNSYLENKTTTDASISEINSDIETIDSKLSELEDNIKNGSAASSLIGEDVQAVSDRVTSLESDNTTNKTNISNLQTDNVANKSDISSLKDKTSRLETNISNLQTNVTEYKEEVSNTYSTKSETISGISAEDNTLTITMADGTEKLVDLDFLIYGEENDIIDGGDDE